MPEARAAATQEEVGSPDFAMAVDRRALPDGQDVLEVHDLVFRYRSRGEPVLKRCSLRIRKGERVLLEGPSGGGKSTLASLLVGLRRPESGLILLRGFDQQTVGSDSWRRHVAGAPQFHRLLPNETGLRGQDRAGPT